MTDRYALPRAAGIIRLIGEKKNHRLSRWVTFVWLDDSYIAIALLLAIYKVSPFSINYYVFPNYVG